MATHRNGRHSRVIIAAAMSAAVFAGTFIVRVPIPATNGYLNLGDPFIVLTGLLFGPVVGMIAGGFGSATADLIGFPVFAIPTLVIKGLAGAVIGLVGYRKRAPQAIAAAFAGEVIVVAGYFAVEVVVFRASMGMPAALTELPFNLIQGIFGMLLGVAAWFALRQRQTVLRDRSSEGA